VGKARLGRVLSGRYRLDELIGRGGMSTVYRALDTHLERSVAVKVFEPGADDDARWESEVRLLSQSSHPNLVTVHDAHLEPRGSDEPSYLVMEYVPGSSLRQHLTESGPSGALSALVISQIGEALASVHSRGIIHRDLKPANILLEPSDVPPLHLRAKLADFGIAHLIGSDGITRTGTMVGTAAYTSPEQVRGEAATSASDVYSLGLVAIETLTGQGPFPGTQAETLVSRLHQGPELPPGLSAECMALLESMTAADPAQRPSALDASMAARALAAEFAEFVAGVIPTSTDQTDQTDQTDPTLSRTRVLPPPATAATSVIEQSHPQVPRRSSDAKRVALIVGATILVGIIAAGVVLGLLLTSHPGFTAPSVPPATVSHTPSVSPTPTPAPSKSKTKPGNGHGHGNH